MKILFLIENEPPIDAVSEWNEIKAYKNKGYLTLSKDAYFMFKALEKNKEFEKEILDSRKNAGIPDRGILWKEFYYDYYLQALTVYSEEESKKYKDFFSKVTNEVTRIIKIMDLDPHIKNQLSNLLIGSFVFPEDFPITYGSTPFDELNPNEGYSNIYIYITHKVTQHQLTTYIKNNWKNMEKRMNSLPPQSKHYISKRDFRIVELRDKEGLDFDEIADKVINEFGIDDLEGKVNVISVSRAYRRAKARINSIRHKS